MSLWTVEKLSEVLNDITAFEDESKTNEDIDTIQMWMLLDEVRTNVRAVLLEEVQAL